MNRFRTIGCKSFLSIKNRLNPPAEQPTLWIASETEFGPAVSRCSDGDYREKDGGARLEEVWHVSMEGCAEWESVTSAIGLSSA